MLHAQVTVSDATGWSGWKAASTGNTIADPLGDQQTGQSSDDFVGGDDGSGTIFYGMAQKTGTLAGHGSDEYIMFRARMDGYDVDNKFGGNGGRFSLGMDLDNSGSIDLIMMMAEGSGNVGNRSRTITFGTPGSGANDAPSTTSWTFQTQTPIDLVVGDTYSLIQASDGSAFNGTPDAWVNFAISFTDFTAAIQTYAKGSFSTFTFDANSEVSYIAYTSTQDNAINQDLFGANKADISSGMTFADLGTLTPSITAAGTPVPEPATYAQIGGFMLVAGALFWRRRRQRLRASLPVQA
ncbi:PEP-CTERM sorting domain-containing protein [Actomonas aquatica]|uniref:PEP-CTERM sorting domain-containing protein n=1 Tax=Actomonas aquatica TaxID=2866162 RepID=A0ABZ1C9Q5_9BACT|nr:PEP-CTERM sorting domain-containing protein [Opitutus sp. WL0086]WRQ88422.1 PEP-CTERM sorting domain-containing protein [Opitutus sp. WL0086]